MVDRVGRKFVRADEFRQRAAGLHADAVLRRDRRDGFSV